MKGNCLSRCHMVISQIDAQAQNIVGVLVVKLLAMRLFVIDDTQSGNVINYLASFMNIEKIVTAIIASISLLLANKVRIKNEIKRKAHGNILTQRQIPIPCSHQVGFCV
jgi:hypothetical protein